MHFLEGAPQAGWSLRFWGVNLGDGLRGGVL